MIPARLKTFKYHREQIEVLLTAKIGIVIVGIVAPVLFFLLFQDIPIKILYTLTLLHFTLFIARIYLGNYFLKNLYIFEDSEIELNLKRYLLIILLSNLLWCASIVYTFIYSDTLHVFILLTALLTIVSGAMVILASIYHAVVIYVMTILPTSTLSLLYFGDKDVHYATSFFLMIFLFVVLISSFKNYQLLESSISQKEEIKLLNISLLQKVERAVNESEEKEKQLLEQARMAQMGEMISMIAHQWRQPLSAISAIVIGLQLRLSIKDSAESEKEFSTLLKDLEEDHNSITELVQFLSTTIDDFRNFFKTDKEKSSVNLTTPINKALQIIESSLNSNNIKVTKDFQDDDQLLLYPNEMIQVILNILKNSEDNFLEKRTSDMQIKISTYQENSEHIISISDNGGGIPEDILKNIFNPYFSTKDDKSGTGIGLYMSKTMIEKHNGGKMSASNTEDGVEFKILLKSDTKS